jgi:uncharacterized protein (DUF58 family)
MTKAIKPRLRLRTWRFPAIVALLLITHLFLPYRGWQVLLVGLGGAWLISYVWARTLARHLRLTREIRFGWAQVGDRMLERFSLTNPSRFPALWVEVIDHSTLPDYQASRGIAVHAKHSTRWHVEAVCTRRGLFTLGPTTLRTGDPFGLYTVTLEYPASLPLLVLPPVVPLPSIEVTPGGRTGDGRPRANAAHRTVSAASVREYAPGDTPRWIHWRTSARHNTLFVRLFDGTPAGDSWILLDMDERVQVGEESDATDEHAVILAASLADRALRSGQAVGLAAHGEQLEWLAPRRGTGQRWEILHTLALAPRGSRPLAEVLLGMQPMFGRGSSLIIITPSRDTDWIEALVPIIQAGAVPTVLWLDPVAFGAGGGQGIVQELLTDLGVAHHPITLDLLDRPEARPGERSRWGRPRREARQTVLAHHSAARAWRTVSG